MGTKIYVGNLSYNLSEEALNNAFAQYGAVASCKIIMDRETGKSKGFAFVEMATEGDAEAAIENLDGAELGGRNLRVNEAKPQVKRDSAPRGRRW